MTTKQRGLSILIGVVGAVASCLALVGFLLKIRRNGLHVTNGNSAQMLYQTVGDAYTGGFVAGFSLSFFLMLLAVAVGTWYESWRDRENPRTDSVRIPLVEKRPGG